MIMHYGSIVSNSGTVNQQLRHIIQTDGRVQIRYCRALSLIYRAMGVTNEYMDRVMTHCRHRPHNKNSEPTTKMNKREKHDDRMQRTRKKHRLPYSEYVLYVNLLKLSYFSLIPRISRVVAKLLHRSFAVPNYSFLPLR